MIVNLNKPFLIAGLTFSIISCSSTPEVRPHKPKITEKQEVIQNYVIGGQKKIYVGDAIIEKGILKYTVSSEGKFKALTNRQDGAFEIIEGKLYDAVYVDSDDGGIYVKGEDAWSGYGNVFAAKVDGNGLLLDSHMFYRNIFWQGNPLTNIGEVGEKMFDPVPTSRKYSPESFKVEIVYLGMSDGVLKASYREYKDDIARPAFYQDLNYTLEDQNYLRYKQFRIKVLNATNEELEYIVLEDQR